MKKIILLLVLVFTLYSCNKEPKDKTTSESFKEQKSNVDETQKNMSEGNLEVSIKDVNDLLKTSDEDQENSSPEKDALEKLLQMGETNSKESPSEMSVENMLSTSSILDMLEASGVSREDMEKLLNNPDSLKILADKAEKNRELAKEDKTEDKGRISKKQLSSKNTPTGLSLEEAILLVQAESGPEATMQKLKTIDSLAGTNVMEQMDLKEAGYLMKDVERKNEVEPSPEEELKMEKLKKISGQMHSEKEAEQLLAELEKTEKDLNSGKLTSSPKYQRTVEYQKKIVKIFHTSFVRKASAAKKKFQQLNPDLYFGDEVGETYVGHMQKAVYLPLGKLSFADKVVKADHPLLMTQQVNNVLQEPDVIKGFLAEDITGIHSLGLGGSLTIQFTDNALTNVNGPDLYIFEIGQIEPTDLEISKDGKNWIKVGKIDGGVAEVDIAKFVKQGELFYYVRLTDLKMQSGLPGADVDAIAAIGAAMRLNLDSQVLFDSGKSELKPEGITAIKELVNSITVLKKGKVIIEGHTDDVGSDQTNQKLSLARAISVSAELKKSIPSSSFTWKEIGLGESKPLVENDSEKNRSKNRRVEILVVPN
jgi:outer membrane protein OmpA-like peptidoglycan-associated protein